MRAGGQQVDHEKAMKAVLAVARRELFLLAIAVGSRDPDGASVASARLQWALTSANGLLVLSGPEGYARRRARLNSVRELANRWLEAARRPPLTTEAIERFIARAAMDGDRTQPAIRASGLELDDLELDDLDFARIDLAGTTLTDITARRAILDDANLTSSRLLRCDLEAIALGRASLRESVLEACELARANLESSTLVNASASRCGFQQARLADTWLDGAIFTDCDFRDATFEVTRTARTGGTIGAQFVRCDLRHTRWTGRHLARAVVIDCKLYGAQGDLTVSGAELLRPDLSPVGDGSQIGAESDVVASWSTGVRRRGPPN